MPDLIATPPDWPTRKRKATEARLVTATFELLGQYGIERLTADLVAEKAGVSRRTFFNYFSSVDAVIRASISDFFNQLSDQLTNRPQAEPLIASLRAAGLGPTEPEFLTQLSLLSTIAEQSESARFMLREFTTDWLYWLENYLKEHHQKLAAERYALNLACAIVAAAESTLLSWYRITKGEITPQTIALYHDLWQQSLNFLESGFTHVLPSHTTERSTD